MLSSRLLKKVNKAVAKARVENQAEAPKDEDGEKSSGKGKLKSKRWTGYSGDQKRIIIPLDVRLLEEKNRNMDTHELLFFLCLRGSGFKELLNSEQIDEESMRIILDAVSKACNCEYLGHIISLMGIINQSKAFITRHIEAFLQDFDNSSDWEGFAEPLEQLGILLCNIQNNLPDPTSERALHLKVLVTKICNCLMAINEELPSTLDKAIDHLETKRKKSKKKIMQTYSSSSSSAIVHPDEFRALPVIPTTEDLHGNSKILIRPVIVEGPYADASDYLDLHFRLLKEDFVRPLRDGFLSLRKMEEEECLEQKIRAFNVYTDVYIKDPEWTYRGIVHSITFDASKLEEFDWENSKCLIQGSLLCLSCDHFNTLLIAIVHERSDILVRYGQLKIHFVDPEDQLTAFDQNKCYMMVESAALFEAYRHNLKVLQSISEDNFPFKDYIVDVKKDVKQISYVDENVEYDISPLYNKPRQGGDDDDSKDDLMIIYESEADEDELEHLKRVKLFDDTAWPSSEELGYDEPQLNAIKGALRQEFCLIQGPPGTGKTFIVLKIIKTILRNKNRVRGNLGPILIASHTNLALDQVLEGALEFSENIVRVGGQSTSEKLQAYNLRKLRIATQYGSKELKICGIKMMKIRDQLQPIADFIFRAQNEILDFDDLRDSMSKAHRESLLSKLEFPERDESRVLELWLQDIDLSEYSGGSKAEKATPNGLETSAGQDAANTPSSTKRETYADEPEGAQKQNGEAGKENEPSIDGSFERGDAKASGVSSSNFEEKLKNVFRISEKDILEQLRKIDEGEFEPLPAPAIQNPLSRKAIPARNPERKNFYCEIHSHLSETEPMTKKEADKVKDVWRLGIHQRWRLYCYWWRIYVKRKYDKYLDLAVQYQSLVDKYASLRADLDKVLINDKDVIGMTTTGTAKFHKLVELLKPTVIIVEEAAQVLEAHVVTTFASHTKHLILVGDHQQLRPQLVVYDLVVNYQLDVSLFERMINNGLPHCRLETQYRMQPTISNLLVPEFYPILRNHEKVLQYSKIKGVEKSFYFISHEQPEQQKETSFYNEFEVDFLFHFCNYLIKQGYDPFQITILTLYKAQLLKIVEKLEKEKLCCEGKISVANVDGYQGRENDIILVSLVRSNNEGKLGFIDVKNRMCVCLSRARIGMYCIGNFQMIRRKSSLWASIIKKAAQKKTIGEGLNICCTNHPGKVRRVVRPIQFETFAPEGGCTEKCRFRYQCGHTCQSPCHPRDADHIELKCPRICKKVLPSCQQKHRCKQLCHVGTDCPPCMSAVHKDLPCGHSQMVDCGVKPTEAKCEAPCEKMLMCGHYCSRKCYEKCSDFPCEVMVGCNLPCGHGSERIQCSKSSNKYLLRICPKPCEKQLACGHRCTGTCGECLQGRLHKKCEQPCERILVCGHKCSYKCGEVCPPCSLPCEVRCKHRKCRKQCSEICSPCEEPCNWKCPHSKCTRTCDMPCDRPPCFEPCGKSLPDCMHPCEGICGEPCPSICKKCERAQHIFVFQQDTDDEPAYYQLEDCGHTFPVYEIDQHMAVVDECIRTKTCPKCEKPIWNGKRYNNAIFQQLKNAYRIKMKILNQNKHDASSRQYALFISLDLPADSTGEVYKLLTKLKICLSEKGKYSMAMLEALENHITFAKRLRYVEHHMLEARKILGLTNTAVEFALSYIGQIVEYILLYVDSTSSDQLHDVDREIRRLEILTGVINWYQHNVSNIKQDAEFEYSKAVVHLVKLNPFNDSLEGEIYESVAKANELQNGVFMKMPSLAKSTLTRGVYPVVNDWFKCPQGHIYCTMVQYGAAAAKESMCTECRITE